MHIQLHPFFIPFLITALVSVFFVAVIWPRRSAPGALPLFVQMLGLVLWSGTSAAMWISTSLNAQLFWLDLSVLGIVLVPATFLAFCLQVSLHARLITRKLIIILSIEPVVDLLLWWTNDWHHLVYSPAQLWIRNGLAALQWSPEPWFYVDMVYMHIVILVGIGFLLHSMNRNGGLHHYQIGLILAGAWIPLLADVIDFVPRPQYFNGLDLAPMLFVLAGAFYVYAMERRKFLDLIPVAHNMLIGSMADCVLVLDVQDRIVEMNPAAGQFLGVAPDKIVGRQAREILTDWKETTQPFWDQFDVDTEIIIDQDTPRYIDLNITPLFNPKKQMIIGRMLVFHDITSRKENEVVLKDANKILQERLEEISILRDQLNEQAIRDPLTNLYNRRYLEESLARELARAQRENYPVCVIMMDIDRFKRVNDTCGHKVGDEVLRSLASLIMLHIRGFDVACRYGGEEFVIVMPKTSVETARERTEFLRKKFANLPQACPEMKSGPTLSIGMAFFPFDGAQAEHLLDAADHALYAAKNAGRNRTVIYAEMDEKKELIEVRHSK